MGRQHRGGRFGVRRNSTITDLDVLVIGAGSAGEAASELGVELGARVAVVERDLVGGECPFYACMPSKALLDAARPAEGSGRHRWDTASGRRDRVIERNGC